MDRSRSSTVLEYVKRDGRVSMKEIDKGVKNKFLWSWLEEKDEDGSFFADYYRKLNEPGMAYCETCKERINYGLNGKKALVSHTKKKNHKAARNAIKNSQALPIALTAVKSMETCVEQTPRPTASHNIPYGASPSIVNFLKKNTAPSEPLIEPAPVAVHLKDRRSHQEGLLCAFIAEHDLPLSIAPSLVALAQELSKDPKALYELKLERDSATYKMKFGVHLVIRKRLLDKMRNTPFSFNIDESTSKSSKKRILNVLVCYFDETTGESVTDHYCSLEMSTVNAETVHEAVTNQMKVDGIPFSNLVSILSDSAAYMRGKHNGFQEKIKEEAAHTVDVGGDTCHTIHNAVKTFCGEFDKDQLLTRFLDDVYNDFHFSADLREELKIIATALDKTPLFPLERISHRWLSIYDTTQRLSQILDELTLFYFAFLSREDQHLYQSFKTDLMKTLCDEKRTDILDSHKRLKSKGTRLTEAGKKRKQRIVKSLFYQQKSLLLQTHTINSVLPLFKAYVLTFEQKCPLIHRLHDEMMATTKSFLISFLRVEGVPDSLKNININDKSLHLPINSIFTGEPTQRILKTLHTDDKKQFLQILKSAYEKCGKYLLEKLPITNGLLKALSSLDPVIQGHSVAQLEMENLMIYFPTLIPISEYETVKASIKQYHVAKKDLFPEFKEHDRLDNWWAQVLPHVPSLGPLIKASLSIFTGPRVEQSFSMMNNIIHKKTSRIDVSTYAAYQAIKYHLINKKKTSTKLFKREDPIYDPVDKPLIYHIQTSWQRFKTQSTKKPKAAEKVKKPSAHDNKEQQQEAIEKNARKSKRQRID